MSRFRTGAAAGFTAAGDGREPAFRASGDGVVVAAGRRAARSPSGPSREGAADSAAGDAEPTGRTGTGTGPDGGLTGPAGELTGLDGGLTASTGRLTGLDGGL
ncbi:hypothetical protein ABT327_10180, partial [Streptomyces pilosus]